VIDKSIAETDVSGAADIWKKVDAIHQVLKRFASTPKDTKGFAGECRSLLQLFHRHQKFDNFTQYHPGTWREVCRDEGAYKYVKFNEIKDKLGLPAADQGRPRKKQSIKQFGEWQTHLSSTCYTV
jgi:hypothetical protein